GNVVVLLISGTASIGNNGESLHIGDFRAQLRRTFDNITALLEAEGATWKDIVRTTCYLRDIERDYEAFNQERTDFYREQDLDPLPASTGIQAILCRPELLVEIEAIAVFRSGALSEEEGYGVGRRRRLPHPCRQMSRGGGACFSLPGARFRSSDAT